MKQEILDKLARLDYAWELQEIRIRKRKLNDPDYPLLGPYREDVLSEINFHKKQAEYFKRRLPMKPKEYNKYIGTLYSCPCCDYKLFYKEVDGIEFFKLDNTYCGRCGQRLMWE